MFHDLVAWADAGTQNLDVKLGEAGQVSAPPVHGDNVTGDNPGEYAMKSTDPNAFVTNSGWAAFPGVALLAYDIYRIINKEEATASEVVTVALKGAKQGAQATTAGVWAAKRFGKSVPNQVGMVANYVGGGATIALGLVQTHAAIQNLHTLHGIGERWDALDRATRLAITEDPELNFFVSRILNGKLKRRKYRAGLDMVAGLASATGGGLGIAVTAGATAGLFIPIAGWIVTGIAMATGVGLAAYKTWRRRERKQKLREFLQASSDIRVPPHDVETIGGYYRWIVATALVELTTGRVHPTRVDRCEALATVLLGCPRRELHRQLVAHGVTGLMGLMAD
ncbi:hypothetical protein [Haliangium sp.]|uniref:hypothetical protein n=1 Tax=Haliangium sp. TaxID=2663208 RepID=UPI003D13794C